MLDLNMELIRKHIRLWLEEDIGTGDVTTLTTIPLEHASKGIIHVKEDGIVCGLRIAQEVFAVVDASLRFETKVVEGSSVYKGTILAEVEGNTRSILLGERLSLNLMQRLSGIATKTREFVDALEGVPTRLVDTRKTTPGHRLLEKYAVRVGGGHNHRFGLYDAVMIKDNHIKGSGGITQAIQAARQQIPHTMKIEVEVENFDQLHEALAAGADIIMLDNMIPAKMKEAVSIIKSKAPHIVVEGSGSVTPQTIKAMAETGVDVISVGRLTYSVAALDISLDLNEQKETAL
ncbi:MULTISPECIES: carboxylating nicotinate-nucleotide diphosphorylase [unclassified Paenibacillus]|uniref:carboxylating nicotinate-nucleotide diphosphorylase n=1 Tax=unclassified Paenibacillus TaxID=185978 RepID=UPI000710A9C2|nr:MULTISPECIES: carboxylating nicotinate-nucleotide diphosphorylase [unclassified Paenibacillus]KQX57759.1 nicotinate-nucleotide pyrophosphorylase [Paenibacillus sp. Root444D2]KRE45453.1 nicotinate-nucleotide pyrophosphorylase [Paenibacillus sp. Soil724D2]MDQ0902832.1 nicotinate-nucleotide pyrophosphorylase (carboxylating) [Paenibacillus sp. V4I7]MDQ0918689.1 nicotinate-nucleotide pyrophosphorylase (carboxylating) [Paenibacillus sp. V4I5]